MQGGILVKTSNSIFIMFAHNTTSILWDIKIMWRFVAFRLNYFRYAYFKNIKCIYNVSFINIRNQATYCISFFRNYNIGINLPKTINANRHNQ